MPYLTEQVQRSRLEEIATRYDVILYPALETVPPKAAIARRNEKMVDGADVVIVYVKRTHGGAAHALRHAQKASKRIYNLYSAEVEKVIR